jgi:hypothetical protein
MIASLYDIALNVVREMDVSKGQLPIELMIDITTTNTALAYFNALPAQLGLDVSGTPISWKQKLIAAYGLILSTEVDDTARPSAIARINALLTCVPVNIEPLTTQEVLKYPGVDHQYDTRKIHCQLLAHPFFTAIKSHNVKFVKAVLDHPIHSIYLALARQLARIYQDQEIVQLIADPNDHDRLMANSALMQFAGRTRATFIINQQSIPDISVMTWVAQRISDAYSTRNRHHLENISSPIGEIELHSSRLHKLIRRGPFTDGQYHLLQYIVTFNDRVVLEYYDELLRMLEIRGHAHNAILEGNLGKLTQLFNENPNLSPDDLLFIAVSYPFPNIITYLLERGADPNHTTTDRFHNCSRGPAKPLTTQPLIE